jgi:hypothetical protein
LIEVIVFLHVDAGIVRARKRAHAAQGARVLPNANCPLDAAPEWRMHDAHVGRKKPRSTKLPFRKFN